jgi:hypothetical protein
MMSGLSGDALVERAEGVLTKGDFAAFLHLLVRNLRDHPEEWENATLEQYLEGLCGFVEGMEGYYSNVGATVDMARPGWRVLADVLLAGRVYE